MLGILEKLISNTRKTFKPIKGKLKVKSDPKGRKT